MPYSAAGLNVLAFNLPNFCDHDRLRGQKETGANISEIRDHTIIPRPISSPSSATDQMVSLGSLQTLGRRGLLL